MKKYIEMQVEIVILQVQDIITFSTGFDVDGEDFGDPNNFVGS